MPPHFVNVDHLKLQESIPDETSRTRVVSVLNGEARTEEYQGSTRNSPGPTVVYSIIAHLEQTDSDIFGVLTMKPGMLSLLRRLLFPCLMQRGNERRIESVPSHDIKTGPILTSDSVTLTSTATAVHPSQPPLSRVHSQHSCDLLPSFPPERLLSTSYLDWRRFLLPLSGYVTCRSQRLLRPECLHNR